MRNPLLALLFAASMSTVVLPGCASTAYNIQERFGIEKRDILADRVGKVADSQNEAKAEFEDALEAFRAVVSVDGGDLEKMYDDLNGAYKRADKQSGDVRSRVSAVKKVARDLFKEWEGELDEYTDARLRNLSEAQLRDTQQRYDVLALKMDAATASMDPVLDVFKDRVLYLKHNLNARAIAALNTETAALESDVAALIAEMEQSINASSAFIREMNGELS